MIEAGWTLQQYAEARERKPRAIRDEYRALLRETDASLLPAPSRIEERDGVVKFCLPVAGGLEAESVIIPMDSYRAASWHTLCVSSQIGCRMGCTFCETGRMGLLRNLEPAEIVTQRLVARELMRQRGELQDGRYHYFRDGIRNIVFMGMGEPLDNFDNVIAAIRACNDPNGLAIPLAQITVSTVGRLDGIARLAELARQEPEWRNLRLAVSLNAPLEELRTALVPINKSMPLAELQRALLEYPLPPRGRMMIAYVLIRGVNDSNEHADLVAEWCRPLACVVNLIPYNAQSDALYSPPDDASVLRFQQRLRAAGVFAKWRVTRGRDLMAACGQLGNPALRKRPLLPSPLPA